MMLPTGGSFMVGGESPPPPAPSSHGGTSSSAGVIVQVGPGSNSSSNSAISTPTSLLTSPVGTPPTPAPSSTSTTLQNLFGILQQNNSNPLTPTTSTLAAFPAFSSNVTLTSNHVRAGSQDAAFVPNSPSTNITLPVIPSGNAPIGLAPLAILSSPSLGSTPTSPFASPVSANHPSNSTGTVSIDVAAATAGASLIGSSPQQLQTTLPSASSSSSSCIISNSTTTSHMNSNAISPTTCSLNQSIAAGGIIGVSSSSQQQPQHCLLVSCNAPSFISTEAQTDNNSTENNNVSCTTPSTSTIAIAPPPRSREHRKRERRERRGRDRTHRITASSTTAATNISSSSSHHHRGTGERGGNSGQGHSSNGYYNHHSSRHHHHHHHRSGAKSSNGISSSSFNSGNTNIGAVVVQQPNCANNFSGSASVYGGSTTNDPSALGDDQCVISEVQSERGTIRGGGDDRLSSVVSPVPTESGATLTLGPPPSGSPLAGMPDLLDSHLPPAPPPYSTLPHHHHPSGVVAAAMQHQQHPPPPMAPVPIPLIPSPVPVSLMPAPPPPTLISPANCIPAQPVRYHFTTAAAAAAGARASRRSMRAHRGVPYASEEEPKTCCGMSASQAVSIRWFIIVIAVIGICCTLAGTALGAARSAAKEHLTLSLLMIGVGVLLLTVSAVAWRLTANESGTSCRAMLGFARSGSSRGDGGAEPNRRFVPRLPPTYGRPHHPYAAMMYPEFQYRAPPPSYQASMQEYRLRLLLLERSNPTIAALGSQAMGHGPVTMIPPPPYRPYSANMRMLPQARLDDYSRPPSYRSRSSGGNANSGEYGGDGTQCSRPSMDPSVGHNHHHHHHNHHHPHHAHIIESPMHSRDPSLLSYLSQQSVDNMSVVSGHHGNPATTTATVVTVVQAVSVGMDIGLGSTLGPPYDGDEDGKGLPSLEGVDDKSCYDPVDDSGHKDGNLVRIVQTTDSSQVIGRDSVIVTVSGGGGSNASLWDTYHHHLSGPATTYAAITAGPTSNNNNNTNNNINNNNNSSSNGVTTTSTSAAPSSSSSSPSASDRDQGGNSGGGSGSNGGSSGTSEVQILAHL